MGHRWVERPPVLSARDTLAYSSATCEPMAMFHCYEQWFPASALRYRTTRNNNNLQQSDPSLWFIGKMLRLRQIVYRQVVVYVCGHTRLSGSYILYRLSFSDGVWPLWMKILSVANGMRFFYLINYLTGSNLTRAFVSELKRRNSGVCHWRMKIDIDNVTMPLYCWLKICLPNFSILVYRHTVLQFTNILLSYDQCDFCP